MFAYMLICTILVTLCIVSLVVTVVMHFTEFILFMYKGYRKLSGTHREKMANLQFLWTNCYVSIFDKDEWFEKGKKDGLIWAYDKDEERTDAKNL